jgi:hypothetical protein
VLHILLSIHLFPALRNDVAPVHGYAVDARREGQAFYGSMVKLWPPGSVERDVFVAVIFKLNAVEGDVADVDRSLYGSSYVNF